MQSAHFVCFEHKSPAKNAIYPKQVRYTRQQIKQRIRKQSILYFAIQHALLFHYMYHEIIIEFFTRPTVTILCRL